MDASIKVIFENPEFLVISKPANLLTHSPSTGISNSSAKGGSALGGQFFWLRQISRRETISNENPESKILNPESSTLVDWLKQRYPGILSVGDDPEIRPGIVHRLDKETSGVMIVAKTQEAFEILKNIFKNREIKKTYLALVLGKMNKNFGEINLAIAKAKTSTKRTTRVRPGQKNSEARTLWRLLKTFKDKNGNFFSLLELEPKTGRTHQIRVHLAAIGHPVLGDYLYGRKTTKSFRNDLPRIFLHAKSLEFRYGDTDYAFEAETPKELTGFLSSLVEISE
ncbi:MAG: Pseudouridine synthase [Parcubacteria group bacterium GW2011_GWC1_45_9]|nr:MAG: Pseudouridine synthase [Parcubacteria group bacterium GW2011_GWA1_Parcubacteria_45_10]KKT88829.1 MAG: Pseudouridine synthase [Parcubacteria group bacterium GW2011_GWB1_45_10]KKU16978.1 MAG: Pseudouridine synthase [Parcubacteria group bacterium GW2011_GWC1_45_9]HCI05137.1 hypothetical protein [Patescibacteria group bacterium]